MMAAVARQATTVSGLQDANPVVHAPLLLASLFTTTSIALLTTSVIRVCILKTSYTLKPLHLPASTDRLCSR